MKVVADLTLLGFEKRDSRLIEGADDGRVCTVLDMVARGDMSQWKAADELDSSRRTIRRAVKESVGCVDCRLWFS